MQIRLIRLKLNVVVEVRSPSKWMRLLRLNGVVMERSQALQPPHHALTDAAGDSMNVRRAGCPGWTFHWVEQKEKGRANVTLNCN